MLPGVPQGSTYYRVEVQLVMTESFFEDWPDFQSHRILFIKIPREAYLAA
jgi:hypothetical protein